MTSVSTLLAALVLSAGPGWGTGTLDAALKEKTPQPILIYVYAHWCTPCNQLQNEVIDTPNGRQLAQGTTALRVDFDADEGQRVNARYGIIGLPTVLVLDATGEELGRVEGYSGKDAFAQELALVRKGTRAVAALKVEVENSPGDLDLLVTYAQALLVHGQQAEAKRLLDKGMGSGGSIGARAVRIWGRWLVRVKKDGAAGAAHFLKYMAIYKGKKPARGFRYWAARSLLLQGKRAEAITLFDEWILVDPQSYDAAAFKADFMVSNGYDLAETEQAVRFAMGLEDEKGWPHYLLAEVLLRRNDRAGAVDAVDRAIRLEPHKAIYQNFRRRRLGLTSP